jgi:hypothetical protein
LRLRFAEHDLLQPSQERGRAGAAGAKQAVLEGVGLLRRTEEREPTVETLAHPKDEIESMARPSARKEEVEGGRNEGERHEDHILQPVHGELDLENGQVPKNDPGGSGSSVHGASG